jgi:hypothetical protein
VVHRSRQIPFVVLALVRPLVFPNSELDPDPDPPEVLLVDPVPVDPLAAEPLLLLELAPVSLIEVAVSVPLEPEAPCTTTESPGRSALRLTERLFETLVAETSLTFTVLPETVLM